MGEIQNSAPGVHEPGMGSASEIEITGIARHPEEITFGQRSAWALKDRNSDTIIRQLIVEHQIPDYMWGKIDDTFGWHKLLLDLKEAGQESVIDVLKNLPASHFKTMEYLMNDRVIPDWNKLFHQPDFVTNMAEFSIQNVVANDSEKTRALNPDLKVWGRDVVAERGLQRMAMGYFATREK